MPYSLISNSYNNNQKSATSSVASNQDNSNTEMSLKTTITPVPTVVATEDGFSINEIAQFAKLLCSPKKAPPPRYQCHICYKTGHYISDCPSVIKKNFLKFWLFYIKFLAF